MQGRRWQARRGWSRSALVGAVLVSVALSGPRPAGAQAPKVLRIATLAPEGSSWMRLFREWDKALEKRTEGRVRLKFQAGGVAGDERDMVRLMRQGRLQGAALTGQGVGLIQPDVRVLELPFLLRSDAELDHIRSVVGDHLRRGLEERGYVVVAWGDAGWIYVFSERPLQSRSEIQKSKVWAWTDDPIVRALLAAFGVAGVPLGVPDVLPALSTGQVDVVYGSPLTTLSLGWHRKVRYVIETPLVYATGAVVMAKRDLDALEPRDRQAVLETGKAMETKLQKAIRDGNQAAMAQLRKAGIQVVKLRPEVVAEFQADGVKVWKRLAGSLYSGEVLQMVQRALADYRSRRK